MSEHNGSERVRAWCKCGGTFDASGRGFDIHRRLTAMKDAWWAAHTGDGHGPTNATQARNARRRQDYADAKALREADR